ncbi:hypothetical protein ES705_19379 [subsurface metagenome]
MEYLEAFFFLMLLLVYVSTLKANTFFIVFGTTIFLFLIMQLLYLDPIEILSGFLNSIFNNPLGFFLLLVPLIIDGLYRGLKKILVFKKD